LFTFVSGYAIDASQERRHFRQSAVEFAKRRFLRIFPLYIPAVLCFVVLFHGLGVWHHWTFAPLGPTIAIQLVGAQVLLSPWYQPILTLWFVGAILIYYALYFAITRLTKRVTLLAAYGVVAFVLGAIARSAVGVLGIQFFLYWFPFLAGVLCHRLRLAAQTRFRLNLTAAAMAAMVGAVVGIGAAAWKIRLFVEADSPALSIPGILPSLVLANLFMLSATPVAWWSARAITARMPPRAGAALCYVAALSYPIYLFHRPCLAAVAAAMEQLGVRQPICQNLGVLFFGLPLVLLLAALLHRGERLLSGLTMRERRQVAQSPQP
jgi:peptidoglycan/LPS O-acetylase OafA/YrhL